MSVAYLKEIPRAYRFAPRVSGALTLRSVTDEADEAVILDTYLSASEAVLWDATNERFYSTGVSQTELAVLDGATKGTVVASKALVVDSSRDLTNLRNLTLTSRITAVEGVITTLSAETMLIASSLSVVGTFNASAAISNNIVMGSTSKYRLNYGSTARDLAQRESSTSANVLIGNASDHLYLHSANVDLYHKRASTNYKVWTEASDGAGSGMDADKLDGWHASSFLRADAFSTLSSSLNVAYGSKIIFYTDESTAGAAFIMNGSDFRLIEPKQSNQVWLEFKDSDNLYILGNEVWHAGNQGAGSEMNSDKVDGLEASQFIRSDTEDTFTGTLTYGNSSGVVLKFGNKTALERLNSTGGTLVGCDGLFIAGAGEAPQTVKTNISDLGSGLSTENAVLCADYDVYMIAGANTWSNRKAMKLDNGGTLSIPGNLIIENSSFTAIGFTGNSDYSAYLYPAGDEGSTGADDVMVIRVDASASIPNYSDGYFEFNGSKGIGYSEDGWQSRSDRRVKNSIRDYEFGNILDKIQALQVRSYKLNSKKGTLRDETRIGVIAQELEELFPSFVTTYSGLQKEMIEAGLPKDLKAVDYSRLSLPLYQGMKEILKLDSARDELIEKQGNKITALTRRITILEKAIKES